MKYELEDVKHDGTTLIPHVPGKKHRPDATIIEVHGANSHKEAKKILGSQWTRQQDLGGAIHIHPISEREAEDGVGDEPGTHRLLPPGLLKKHYPDRSYDS